jgi:hypothetical protein
MFQTPQIREVHRENGRGDIARRTRGETEDTEVKGVAMSQSTVQLAGLAKVDILKMIPVRPSLQDPSA